MSETELKKDINYLIKAMQESAKISASAIRAQIMKNTWGDNNE